MLRLAVLISGRGSNMQAIIHCCQRPDVAAEVALVIADRPAPGLASARQHGIASHLIDASQDKTRFEARLATLINRHDCHLICLAGFMRLLSADFCQQYPRRIINIHPSLLPAYKGLDTHKRVLAAGETQHGCTLHLVTAELDSGEILAQARVAVLAGDSEATLAARVLVEEHRLYAECIAKIADNHRHGRPLF